jgi:hypothetical protein
MITLIVDYDAQLGLWYFVVKEGEEVIHFRPGFRTREDAQETGDIWIRTELGAHPSDEQEED